MTRTSRGCEKGCKGRILRTDLKIYYPNYLVSLHCFNSCVRRSSKYYFVSILLSSNNSGKWQLMSIFSHSANLQTSINVHPGRSAFIHCWSSGGSTRAKLTGATTSPEVKHNSSSKHARHRRRIYLEDKAKVIASDWRTESLPR